MDATAQTTPATRESVQAQLLASPVFAEEAERTDWLINVLPRLDSTGLAEVAQLLSKAEEIKAAAETEELRLLNEQNKTLNALLHKAKAAVLAAQEDEELANVDAQLAAVAAEMENA